MYIFRVEKVVEKGRSADILSLFVSKSFIPEGTYLIVCIVLTLYHTILTFNAFPNNKFWTLPN